MVICIGREFGSGGHDVGHELAQLLGIPYYDKKLIDDMEGLGMDRQLIEKADESKSSGLFNTPYYGVTEARLKGMNINDIVYQLQCEWICETAQKGHCVIVGRSADSVCEHAGIPYVSIFITSPYINRVEKEMADHGLSERDAASAVIKADKQRRAYYNYYTDKEWASPSSYDICINAGVYGIDNTAQFLYKLLADELDNKENIYYKRSETY